LNTSKAIATEPVPEESLAALSVMAPGAAALTPIMIAMLACEYFAILNQAETTPPVSSTG
jgi:hypothetical protein